MNDLLTAAEAAEYLRDRIADRAPTVKMMQAYARPSRRAILSQDHPMIALDVRPVARPFGISPGRYRNMWRRADLDRLVAAVS